jgi:GT2 family glycosyltransferase
VLSVDVVIVAYNSRDHLAGCVEPFASAEGTTVFVVDNACPQRSYEVVQGLPSVRIVHMPLNGGFAYGCNAGWRAGISPYVLFLNPDARLGAAGVAALSEELDDHPRVGVVGPRTLNEDGSLNYTIRHFPSLPTTYAQALFVHKLVPTARWVDEVVRRPDAYERRASVDWLSGSCLLTRRSVLESIGGLDEGFFFYSEDIDFCRRVQRDAGTDVVYTPRTECVHLGGRSRPRAELLPMLASSRLRYANAHRGAVAARLERLGIGIGEAVRSVVGRGDAAHRRGHRRALGVILRGEDAYRLPDMPSAAGDAKARTYS